jgi:hypothetical protein
MKQHLEGVLWAVSFLSLVLAAIATGRGYLLIVSIIWVFSTTLVVPLHFTKAWRRWSKVPNRRQYAMWVGFETLATVALIGVFIYPVFSR